MKATYSCRKDDLLENFPVDPPGVLDTVIRTTAIAFMCFTFPLKLYSVRRNVGVLLRRVVHGYPAQPSLVHRIAETTVLVSVIGFVGTLFPEIHIVLGTYMYMLPLD